METINEILEELRSGEFAPLVDRIEAALKREREAGAEAVHGLMARLGAAENRKRGGGMSMICPHHNCLDNVRGECFSGGCSRMPEIEREENEPEEDEDDEP